MSGIRCIFRAALALVVFLRKPSKATIYSHRTGENMRTASRSSNSRCPTLQGHDIHPRFATIPSPVIRYLINDFGKIVGYLTLSPQAHALVANLLTLIPTLIKVKRNLPSMSFYESHRRQSSITRFARLNKQRSGELCLFRSAPKS